MWDASQRGVCRVDMPTYSLLVFPLRRGVTRGGKTTRGGTGGKSKVGKRGGD